MSPKLFWTKNGDDRQALFKVFNEDVLTTLSNIYDGMFCENSSQLLVVYYFLEKAPSWFFDKVSNTSLFDIILHY